MSLLGLRRSLAAIAVTALALPVSLGLFTSPAHAASGCWDAGFRNSGYEAYYCNNKANTPLWNSEFTAVVGHLTTTTSWFACRIDYGPSNGEGSPHPNRWLWTLGDNSNEAWGYADDRNISSETNPVHAC